MMQSLPTVTRASEGVFCVRLHECEWKMDESCIKAGKTTLLLKFSYQQTTVTLSSHVHGTLGLAAAVSMCVDQQFGTNFHRMCKAQALRNSLYVVLRAGCLSVHNTVATLFVIMIG